MKKRYKILVLLSLISLCIVPLSGCSTSQGIRWAEALSSGKFQTDEVQDDLINQPTLEGINNLGYEILKDISSNNNDNIIFSPLSLSCALAMLANGAEAETKTEIITALGAEEDDMNTSYNQLINHLNSYSSDEDTILNIANSAWFNQYLDINKTFVDDLKKYYDADSLSVDFNDAGTKDSMNDWISEKTEGLLEDTIKEINPQIAAMLINTLYFKGTWLNEFDKQQTNKEEFSLDNGTSVDVDMMFGNFDEEYYEDKSCQIVQLSYNNASMYVVLPKSDIALFIESEDFKMIDSKIAQTESENVDVYLPKLKYRSSIDLVEHLKNSGIKRSFDSNEAQFKPITDSDLVVSSVVQDAFIEVNEEGTEAAAATVITIELTCALIEDVKQFNCNKPFLYIIKDDKTGVNLFTGVVMNPSE